MATTVSQLLTQIYPMVMESGITFPKGLWSQSEVINYINLVQDNLFQNSQSYKIESAVSVVVGQLAYSDPSSSMQLDRIDLDRIPLYRSTRDHLDGSDKKWRLRTGIPKKYTQDYLPTKTFQLDKKPSSVLTGKFMNIIHCPVPALVAATADNLTIPDYMVLYLKFGVLHRMFAKQGEAQDLKRAQYCLDRFNRGVQIFQRLMGNLEPSSAEQAAMTLPKAE